MDMIKNNNERKIIMERLRGFEVAKGFENKGIKLPERKTKCSAAYDLEAAEDIVVPPGNHARIQLCLQIVIYICFPQSRLR